MKLGDKVSGFYKGVTFVGVLVGFDCSGGLTIDCPDKFTLFGTERDGVYIHRFDRAAAKLTLMESGPELAADDVIDHQGHVFLRRR